MTRPVGANGTITLPNLSVNEAHTLAQFLEAAALDENGEMRPLPETAIAALGDLGTHRAALLEEVGSASMSGRNMSKTDMRKIDMREDSAVEALDKLIDAFAKLAGEIPEGDIARSLQVRLFPDGTAFLKVPPLQEWAEVESRLGIIDQEHLADDLKAIGAAPLLAHLRKVHVDYGRATGATTPLLGEETLQLRDRLDALLEGIRNYVAAVASSVERDKPETRALAEILCKPLIEWGSRDEE